VRPFGECRNAHVPYSVRSLLLVEEFLVFFRPIWREENRLQAVNPRTLAVLAYSNPTPRLEFCRGTVIRLEFLSMGNGRKSL
jgi:hypothetical protein